MDFLEEQRRFVEIKRITLLSCAVSILSLFLCIQAYISKFDYLYAYLTAVIALVSFVHFMLSLFLQKKPEASVFVVMRAAFTYWFIIMLCFMPPFYLQASVDTGLRYIVLLTIFTWMLFSPVYNLRILKRLYICVLLGVFLVSVAAGGDIIYCAYVFAIGFVFCLCGYSIHGGYYRILKMLRAEGDTDGMTKLYTRTAGLTRMGILRAMCRRNNRMVAVYYLDIDYFKSYNDTYGHAEGDVALIKVAGCLKNCFSRDADIVARLGGEEFGIMVPVKDEGIAMRMGCKILQAVSDMKIKSGEAAQLPILTISVGLAVSDPRADSRETVDTLLDMADQQLYIAKSKGRNRLAMNNMVVYHNSLSLTR